MSISNFFNSSEKNQKIGYLKFLISTALADGIMHPSEMALLKKVSSKMGFTELELEKLLENPEATDFHPSFDLEDRFSEVFGIMRMVMEDGELTKEEVAFSKYFAITAGFHHEEALDLVHFIAKGIEEDKDEDELFEKYRKGAIRK